MESDHPETEAPQVQLDISDTGKLPVAKGQLDSAIQDFEKLAEMAHGFALLYRGYSETLKPNDPPSTQAP